MKTKIEMVHIYGTNEDDKVRIKQNLERDGALLASFVQYTDGCFSFLVTKQDNA
jgi:hypothetical protein